jgi:hypothetical protein
MDREKELYTNLEDFLYTWTSIMKSVNDISQFKTTIKFKYTQSFAES